MASFTVKTNTVRNTDYVTVGIGIINDNTKEIKEKIEKLANGIGFVIDDKVKDSKASIEISKATVSNIDIDNNGISIFTDDRTGGAKGYICIDEEDKKSHAYFDKIQCGELINESSVVIKNNELISIEEEQEPAIFSGDKSDYIVNVMLTVKSPQASPEFDGNADIELSFDECKSGQVINVIFGNLNGNTINSISLYGGNFEFANGYKDDEKKVLDDSYINDGDYNTQLSFMVQEIVGGTSKIIVLK